MFSMALSERHGLIEQIFKQYDESLLGSLNELQLQSIHMDMRLGGISLPQVRAAVAYTCVGDECDKEELFDVLQEMDRRYFLIQDLRWEFTMLDYNQTDTISEESAKWLVQSVHDRFFSKRGWEKFLRGRAVPGSGVSFAEIEVMLCNIPSITDILDEEEEENRLAEERARKQQEIERRMQEERDRIRNKRDEERKRREEEEQKQKASQDKRRKEEEMERLQRQKEKDDEDRRRADLKEEEERGAREAEERERKLREEKEKEEKERQELLEMQRLKEVEQRTAEEEEARRAREADEALEDEEILKQAIIDEKDSHQKMEDARGKAQKAKDARSKKEHEDEEKKQRLRHKEAKNKRIRYQLKVSYKKREKNKLPGAVKDFKDAKLPDDDLDLEKAEKLLREWTAKDGLKNAMDKRQLKELEAAMNFVRRNGFEPQLAKEMIEANKLLLQLRRLERIRAEILELKQSTVAEIRSYSKPPAIVHTVMIATFLLHGHPEKVTKDVEIVDECEAEQEVLEDWKTVQALVGKTGKEGLKRRCLEFEPHKLNPKVAARAKELFGGFSLDDVRDVSAGAATFYLWGTTMIEELESKQAADAAEAEAKAT